MYKVDTKARQLIELAPKKISELGMKERFDLEEWVEKSPRILGEDLLIIGKEVPLPSGLRVDLLGIDKHANLVIIELKRDESGPAVEWQAIKYASYCSNMLRDEIFARFAEYLQCDRDDASLKVEEFIDSELEALNKSQRIILVAREFHSDVVSAVLWLRDFEIDIMCVRLRSYVDDDGDLFITPEAIIPLPEASTYIKGKEVKAKESSLFPAWSSFSLERGTFALSELEQRWKATLSRQTELTPRFVRLIEILLSEDRVFGREEIRQKLFERGVGIDIGQAGRYLSNLSQFLTKKSNPHLRQVIEFVSEGGHGKVKDNYRVVPEYRTLLTHLLDDWKKKNGE
jgi:hypothetical protein